MDCVVGIDLGSTTTKAVILNDKGELIGCGITNSRSNYDVASRIARTEAFTNARFSILQRRAKEKGLMKNSGNEFLEFLGRQFFLQGYLKQLSSLRDLSFQVISEEKYRSLNPDLEKVLAEIFQAIEEKSGKEFMETRQRKSDFFRDLAGSMYQSLAVKHAKPGGISFDFLMSVYERVIFKVENQVSEISFGDLMNGVVQRLGQDQTFLKYQKDWLPLIEEAATISFEEVDLVGTGYGRQRLPFPKDCIQSEILCHGYGAHHMFEGTATVLDIGGQDTKAIQVDENGVVTSFQMNDRCAAGCGRYLGYIADEMNLGLHELGPLALQAGRSLKINSTCTVFAGAELRDRLALGQKREDILSGLHRAMILRAMSLLARSGGIRSEFTFTGGVAKNTAAVKALKELVYENYGEMKTNIHPNSIFTGALGAALFALEKPKGFKLPTAKRN